ncbi:MAG: TRAP transporter small permease [Bacteroidota bacterium]
MKKQITRLLKYGTLLSTYGLLASVLLQIFARFFLPNTPPWTEEASRLFFIYAIAFSGGLAVQSKEYVALDVVYERFSTEWKRWILMAVQACTLLLFGLMAIYALKFTKLGLPETAPAMKISMSIAFFSMFVLAFFICYFTYFELRKIFKNKSL